MGDKATSVAAVEIEPGTFEIGLVMAGAISAGAYTAGVIDFLYEALDAWEAAKLDDKDNTPAHRVKIRVITGASAGGMTAALIGSTIQRAVTPVTQTLLTSKQYRPGSNPFYDAWVDQIDIRKLLSTTDLSNGDEVRSVLNGAVLQGLADEVFKGTIEPTRRPYFSDVVDLYLTVTNVAGVPYQIRMKGSDAAHSMKLHKDFVHFALNGKAGDPHAVSTEKLDGKEWQAVRTAAIASGAFPVGLSAIQLKRLSDDYGERLSHFARRAGGRVEFVKPNWGLKQGSPYNVAAIDGGMMDNEPLELARRCLAGVPVSDDDLARQVTNDRNGQTANRALILIDPFPDAFTLSEEEAAKDAKLNLFTIVKGLIPAFKDQARFKPEELTLAMDETIFSRFMVAPVRELPPDPKDPQARQVTTTIASSGLGGFGGFLFREFRDHDYQLGRRNCQKFLKDGFLLPANNVVMNEFGKDELRQKYMVSVRLDADGVAMDDLAADREEQKTGTKLRRADYLPIIPLVGDLKNSPVPQPAWPQVRQQDVRDLLTDPLTERLTAVLNNLTRGSQASSSVKTILRLGSMFFKGKIVKAAVSAAIAELTKNGQISNPDPPKANVPPTDPNRRMQFGGRPGM